MSESSDARAARQSHHEQSMRPSPLACTECRRKHLKCDANLPVCARCTAAGLHCSYKPSRRGYRKRHAEFDEATGRGFIPSFDGSQPIRWSSTFPLDATSPVSTTSLAGPASLMIPVASPAASRRCSDETSFQLQSSSMADDASSAASSAEEDEGLVNLFYANFHAAHPILVPRHLYPQQSYPRYLRLVVQFIGSHFSPTTSSDAFRAETAAALLDAQKTCHMVQARLLFAIALHARNEVKEAQSVLGEAVELAIELGMNERSFAYMHGSQQAIKEESLRRTWWELYITDGYMAALHRKSSFRSHSVKTDVFLPCEESVYSDGVDGCLPEPVSMDQFDGRLFNDDEVEFSSFCYRIEAVRILARVLAIGGTQDVHQDTVQAIDNKLAAWVHHLPAGKADVINAYGQVDEMLFQAHMLVQYAIIFLHFPRSNLTSTAAATADITCTHSKQHLSPTSTSHTHTIKAIEGSKQLANLATFHLPVQKHTPFFICGLVLSAIVQLAACSVHGPCCLEQHRDRVALITGVLKSLSQTWALAHLILQQVKKVAAKVLQVGAGQQNANPVQKGTSSGDSGIDMGTGGGPAGEGPISSSAVGDDPAWMAMLDSELQSFMDLDNTSNSYMTSMYEH